MYYGIQGIAECVWYLFFMYLHIICVSLGCPKRQSESRPKDAVCLLLPHWLTLGHHSCLPGYLWNRVWKSLCQMYCKGFYQPLLASHMGELGDLDSLHCIYKVQGSNDTKVIFSRCLTEIKIHLITFQIIWLLQRLPQVLSQVSLWS